jgi:hypothetical protein
MKKLTSMLMILCLLFAVTANAQLRTQAPAVSDSLSGLSYRSFNEALTGQTTFTVGNKNAVATLEYDQLKFSPMSNGGYNQRVYSATGYADGTGGFTIDLNAPAGAVVQYVQMRVDVLLVSATGVSWSAALSGGSSSTITTGQAFAQNTKVSTMFASPVLTGTTDIVVTPNAGDLTAGVITAYVSVMEPIALENTKAITYSSRTLSETANAGAIDNTTPITLTLTGATYAWANGVDFVANGYATVSGVPDDLTLVLTKISDTVLSLTATGNAVAHDDADNVTDAEIVLGAKAFAYGVSPDDVIYASIDDLAFSFTSASMAYSAATFTEADANDGSIDTSITITLSGDTFTGTDGDDFVDDSKIVVTNLPTTLTVVATKTSDTVLTVTMTGTADAHASAQDVANLTFTFADTAFTVNDADEVTNYAKADLAIDFADAPTLAYSAATFAEADANDGSIDNSSPITITLTGDTFTGSDTDDFVSDGKIVVTNLPTTLTAVATRTSDTVLTVTITGTADAHEDANDVADLTFTFDDTAFTLVDAANITNYAKADLAIDFADAPVLAYSASTFTEAIANDGSIDNSSPITITLTGDTFTGSDTDDFVSDGKIVVTNNPANLVVVATRTSSTVLSITITGTATAHANINDVADLTFAFDDTAFTLVGSADITNSTKADLAIDFSD